MNYRLKSCDVCEAHQCIGLVKLCAFGEPELAIFSSNDAPSGANALLVGGLTPPGLPSLQCKKGAVSIGDYFVRGKGWVPQAEFESKWEVQS